MTSATEVYTPKFSLRLAIALVGSMPRVLDAIAKVQVRDASKVATDDLYPVGTRVELYWYGDQAWYQGTVIDSKVRKGVVHGVSIDRREIQVIYDADEAKLWHALCDYSVRLASDAESAANLAVLSLLDDRHTSLDDIEARGTSVFNAMSLKLHPLKLGAFLLPGLAAGGTFLVVRRVRRRWQYEAVRV